MAAEVQVYGAAIFWACGTHESKIRVVDGHHDRWWIWPEIAEEKQPVEGIVTDRPSIQMAWKKQNELNLR